MVNKNNDSLIEKGKLKTFKKQFSTQSKIFQILDNNV